MYKVITYVSTISILLPFIVGLLRKSYKQENTKLFFVFILVSLLTELVNLIFSIESINNLRVLNLFLLVNLFFMGYIYYEKYLNIMIMWVVAITLTGMIISLFVFGISEINTINFYIAFIELILFSLIVLRKVSIDVETGIFDKAIFWIAFGSLLYCSTTLMTFTLSSYLIFGNSTVLAGFYFILNGVMNIITNCIYARAFLCRH